MKSVVSMTRADAARFYRDQYRSAMPQAWFDDSRRQGTTEAGARAYLHTGTRLPTVSGRLRGGSSEASVSRVSLEDIGSSARGIVNGFRTGLVPDQNAQPKSDFRFFGRKLDESLGHTGEAVTEIDEKSAGYLKARQSVYGEKAQLFTGELEKIQRRYTPEQYEQLLRGEIRAFGDGKSITDFYSGKAVTALGGQVGIERLGESTGDPHTYVLPKGVAQGGQVIDDADVTENYTKALGAAGSGYELVTAQHKPRHGAIGSILQTHNDIMGSVGLNAGKIKDSQIHDIEYQVGRVASAYPGLSFMGREVAATAGGSEGVRGYDEFFTKTLGMNEKTYGDIESIGDTVGNFAIGVASMFAPGIGLAAGAGFRVGQAAEADADASRTGKNADWGKVAQDVGTDVALYALRRYLAAKAVADGASGNWDTALNVFDRGGAAVIGTLAKTGDLKRAAFAGAVGYVGTTEFMQRENLGELRVAYSSATAAAGAHVFDNADVNATLYAATAAGAQTAAQDALRRAMPEAKVQPNPGARSSFLAPLERTRLKTAPEFGRGGE